MLAFQPHSSIIYSKSSTEGSYILIYYTPINIGHSIPAIMPRREAIFSFYDLHAIDMEQNVFFT